MWRETLGCHWSQVSLESCCPMVMYVDTYYAPSCNWLRRDLLDYQKHCYDFPDDLPISCWNHDDNYLRWVRFRAHEIPWSENGTMPIQPQQLTDSTKVSRKDFWCDWAMGTKTYNGLSNPHQEWCHMSSRRYVTCQHEGCDTGHMFYQCRTGVIRWNQLQCVLYEQCNCSE